MLGLIAGQGAFPLLVARAAKESGQPLSCVAFRGVSNSAIDDVQDDVTWIHLGEVVRGIGVFREAGVVEAVMAGKIPKDVLFGNLDLKLDGQAQDLMRAIPDQADDTILGKVADFLEAAGIRLLPQWALAPELLVGPGSLGKTAPTPAQLADIAFGFPLAKQIGALDIGQTIVVKDRAVIAVEAIDGTDATIRRAGNLMPGTCVVKVAKPRQDPRFDVPTIGVETVETLVAAAAGALAFEAGATVVLERAAVARAADAAGIAIVGIDPDADLPDAP